MDGPRRLPDAASEQRPEGADGTSTLGRSPTPPSTTPGSRCVRRVMLDLAVAPNEEIFPAPPHPRTLAVAQALIVASARPNAVDDMGQTPHLASRWAYPAPRRRGRSPCPTARHARSALRDADRNFAMVGQHALAQAVRAARGNAVKQWSGYHRERYGWWFPDRRRLRVDRYDLPDCGVLGEYRSVLPWAERDVRPEGASSGAA